MDLYVSQFLLFIMLFIRITSMLVIVPVFGHQGVPVQVKVAMGLFLAFVLYPVVSQSAPSIDSAFVSIVLVALKEVAVGVLIGFAVSLLFAGVRYAGELISMDTGLSMAAMFDPETNRQTTVISESLYLVMLMTFLLLDGHHFVLEALQLSYVAAPIGTFSVNGAMSAALVKMTGMVFVIAAKLAAPVLVSMFLINVALSILARVMPQMNIFAVVFPLKIGVGFIAIMISAPMMVFVFKKMLGGFESNIVELVKVF